jgi:hypothetical protein
LTARNSPATREIASDQVPTKRLVRTGGDARSGRVASSVVSVGQASQVTRSRGRKLENLTTSMPREPENAITTS